MGYWRRDPNSEDWKIFAAGEAVRYAVRSGKLTRGPCEVCGEPKTHGHHNSYEEIDQLDVRWLCPKHHVALHKRLREIEDENDEKEKA